VDDPLWFDLQIIMPSTRILVFFNPASIGAKEQGGLGQRSPPVGAPEEWVNDNPPEGRPFTGPS
jgi:hypothetical protein